MTAIRSKLNARAPEFKASQAAMTALVADLSAKEDNPKWDVDPWSDGYPATAPVGSFAPNGFGLFDTAGNVWEWCSNELYHYASVAPPGDGRHTVPDELYAGSRILRGGAWTMSSPYSRASMRYLESDAPRNDRGVRPIRPVSLLPADHKETK